MAPVDYRGPSDEITRHHAGRPDADAWVAGYTQAPYRIEVSEYDDRWPADFERIAEAIRTALGERVLELHHVGSTSVPGLPAKPIVDVDLVLADPADEASYVPDLVAVGFVHALREPWWHEHRLLKGDEPRSFVHVFGRDCPEVIRHLMFREWLLAHADDRTRYAEAKRRAAEELNASPGGGTGMDYNRHKEPVVRAIYERMFRAHGMLR